MCLFLHKHIMHHLASHSLKSTVSHKIFISREVARRKVYRPTRIHDTRAIIRKMADFLEQENQLLKEEMTTMQAKMNEMAAMQAQVDELTELVRTLKAAQNQPPPPSSPVSTQAEASPSTIFGGTAPFSTLQQTIPEGRPWGVH